MSSLPILMALAAAALTAAAVLLLCSWPWRAPHTGRASAGAVLGVGGGLGAGIVLLGATPRWPPREDQDRLLLLLFPAVLAIELVAPFLGRLRWLAWLPRLVVAGGAPRVLLHNTIYL